jgi:hypothetical protein
MSEGMAFDPTFDFRTDAGGGDPDATSPTLRAYHKLVWTKPLPGGELFELNDTEPGAYLLHQSRRGKFFLASDSAMPTFRKYQRMAHIMSLMPESEREEFGTITYQMGGMMLFPGNRIDGKQTINGARGFNPRIADRLDLTLECIRLHYLGEMNPLAETLDRYRNFFALFENFRGYIDFFLLQDMVSEDKSAVRLFLPFDDFRTPPLPASVEAYRDYRENATSFVKARNRRMAESVAGRVGI